MDTQVCVFLHVFETESYYFFNLFIYYYFFLVGGGFGGALIGTHWQGAANAG